MTTTQTLKGSELNVVQWQVTGHSQPLSTSYAHHMIDQIADIGTAKLVIRGDNPMQRKDLFSLIDYATSRNISVSLATEGIAKMSVRAAANARDAGISRWAIRMNTWPDLLDTLSAFRISELRPFRAGYLLADHDVPIEIDTTVTNANLKHLEQIADIAQYVFGAKTWNVEMGTPSKRVMSRQMVTADQAEHLLRWMYKETSMRTIQITTTDAPFYERIMLQERSKQSHDRSMPDADREITDDQLVTIGAQKIPHDGNGEIFISHQGDVYPSEHLPLIVGNIRKHELGDVYEHSPLLQELRTGDRLHGKCSECVFRNVCGGSRARAFAMTGDYMAADPLCAYVPTLMRSPLSPIQ